MKDEKALKKQTEGKKETKPAITEEQARILLEQSKIETERNLGGGKRMGKKLVMIGLILLAAAILVALLSNMLMEGFRK